MSAQIAVRIPERDLAALDEAVSAGRFASRAEAIREGVARLLRERREEEVAAIYREAYGRDPDDARIGDAGAAVAAELFRADEDPSA